MDCERQAMFFYLTATKAPSRPSLFAVCQDFRVREDGALASKLQEEEYQKHYFKNKSERKTVRGDVRVAKQTYLEEVKTAQLLPQQELEQISSEETDKWLARDLQEKLHSEERKEMERQKRLAHHDAKVAKSLQNREKEKREREWRRRREEEMLGREQQEREHQEMEEQEVDEQTAIELRDAKLARELQEREKEMYERERERYRQERDRERHRHEREQRRERERERMDGQEIDSHGREHEREQRRERERMDGQEINSHEREQRRERMDGQEIDSQKELEMRDARIARELQEREKQKFDREWQRRKEQEMLIEQERRNYRRSSSEPIERERGTRRTASRPEHNPVTMNGHTEPGIHRQSRQGSGREDRREKRESSGSNSSGGSVGNGKEVERKPTVYQKLPKDDRRPPKDVQRSPKDERRSPIDDRRLPKDDHRPPKDGRRSPKDERRSPKVDRKPREERRRDNAENAVVAVPVPTTENGGGRLERDKIIMADGTEIHLFDDEEDPQKDLERQKLKKDEEFAKMLQDQERRISEAEKMATEDRRLAMEEQDRELARHLQRKEYHRMQQEKKERQMRRANSIPSDRHSVNIEDPRRLPSYAEAIHHHQLPDVLPGSDPSSTRYSYVSTVSSVQGSSLERDVNAHVEREKYAAQEQERSLRHDLRPRGINESDYSRSHGINESDYRRSHGTNKSDYSRSREIDDSDHLQSFPIDEPDHVNSRGTPQSHGIDESNSLRYCDFEGDQRVTSLEHQTDLSCGRGSARDDYESRMVDQDVRPHERDYRGDDLKDKVNPREQRYVDDKEDRHPPREATQPPREERHPPRGDRHPHDQEQRQSFPIVTDFECPKDEQDDNESQTNIEQPVWQTREPERDSPSSSLERLKDNSENNQLSARSSYASSGGNSYDRRSQISGTPPTREGVWERFDDDDEFSMATGRSSRQIFRSQTHPLSKDSDQYSSYNVVEGIDPTFRRQRKSSEDDPKENNNTEDRSKFMPLIKPHRRRSAEKKKSKDRKK